MAAPTKVDPVRINAHADQSAAHKTDGSIVRNRRLAGLARRRRPGRSFAVDTRAPSARRSLVVAHKNNFRLSRRTMIPGSRVPGNHYRCRIPTLQTMISALLSTASGDRRGVLVAAVLVAAIIIGSPACGATTDTIPTDSNGRDTVYSYSPDHQGFNVVGDISQQSDKEIAAKTNDRSNRPDPSEMYYFAPKNAQNNKSSIVGRCLDVETLEDLLNTAQKEHVNSLDLYNVPDFKNIVLPIRATYSTMVTIFNPYTELLQVVKLFGGGPGFHLSLPSGRMKGRRNVWDIMPYETKPVIQFTFTDRSKKNYSVNIGLFLSNHHYISVPVNVVTVPKPGLYSPELTMDFGVSSEIGLVRTKSLKLCSSAMSTIIVKNITSDSYFMTVDFPGVLEIPPRSCIANYATNISFHWNEVGYYSYDKTQHGYLTVKCNKGNDLSIPFYGKTLTGELVYDEGSLHFVMWKEIRSSSIVKHFSLLNGFSSTTISVLQVKIQKNVMQYFKIGNFKPVILKPGQNKTLFHVGYVNPIMFSKSIISYLQIKTNVSVLTVPLFVYSGLITRILPVTDVISFPPIAISTPRHTYIVFVNKNPVAIMIKNWGTSFTKHAMLYLVEIGKFDAAMQSSKSNWARPKVYENRTPTPVSLPANHYAIYQLLVYMPDQSNNLTIETWIQTFDHRYIVLLKLFEIEKLITVVDNPLTFEECLPGTVCNTNVYISSKANQLLHLSVIKSSYTEHNAKFVPKVPSYMHPQTVSMVGHITWTPKEFKNPSSCLGLHNKTERTMWLSSFNLTCTSEISLMDFSWFNHRLAHFQWENSLYNTKQQYFLEADDKSFDEFTFDVQFNLNWPKFVLEQRENRQHTVFELPTGEVDGLPHYQKILLKNTLNKEDVTFHFALYPDPYQCNITEFKRLFEYEVNTLSISQNDWELVLDNSSPYRRKSLRTSRGIYKPHNKTMLFVLPPQKELEVSVKFQPKRLGASMSIVFIRNDQTILESVLLKGTGMYPVLSFGSKNKLSPLVFDIKMVPTDEFKCENVSMPSKIRIFIIKNNSKRPIRIASMAIDGALCNNDVFKILHCKTFTLSPEQSKKVSVEFTADSRHTTIKSDLEINVEETVEWGTVNHLIIYKLWSIMPSKWLACMELVRGDDLIEPAVDLSVYTIIVYVIVAVILAILIWYIWWFRAAKKQKQKNRKMIRLIKKNAKK